MYILEVELKLCITYRGIIVPGGFGEKGIEGMIRAANWARTRNIPYLGICLGMQIAVIEFARNVCGLTGKRPPIGMAQWTLVLTFNRRKLGRNGQRSQDIRNPSCHVYA